METLRRLSKVFMLIPVALCSGCLGPMVHAINSGHPTFAETEKVWPPMNAGNGRVVIFMQRNVAGEILIGLPSSGFRIDDKYNEVLGGTFLWSDLPVGEHTIRVGGMLFASKENVPVTVKDGQVSFIELQGKSAPKLLKRDPAMLAIAKCHHVRKDGGAIPLVK